MAAHNKFTCVITGCDYFAGHEIAKKLLQNKQEFDAGSGCQMICTGVHKERMEDLHRSGAEIRVINPEDINSMEQAYKNADFLIVEPIPEGGNCVENANRMFEAMKKANVKNVVLMSCRGADANEAKFKYLRECHEIEKKLCNSGLNWTIVRTDFCQNWLHLWSYIVEDKGQLPMCIGSNGKFAPIRIDDIALAVKDIMKSERSGGLVNQVVSAVTGSHKKQTYTLTGPEAMNGTKIVEELNRVVQGQVQFKDVDRNQMEQMLRSLRDRNQKSAQQHQTQASGGNISEGDRHHKFMGQPTDMQIQMLLDYMEFIKTSKVENTTEDFKKITGKEAQKIHLFFKDHQNEFRQTNAGRQTA